MELRERENETRRARGVAPLPMPKEWTERPRLGPHERELFGDFLQLATACAGDVRLVDVVAWLDVQQVPPGERSWLCEVFGALGGVLRERNDG